MNQSCIMEIPNKYRATLLTALEEYMYQVSLQLAALKGQPLTKKRKELTKRQAELEKLQHLISTAT